METRQGKSEWIDDAIERATSRVQTLLAQTSDFPHITQENVWQTTTDGVWTGGFWAGLLWLNYEFERDASVLAKAVQFTDRLLPRAQDSYNHDLGFIFFPSAIKGWQLTGEKRFRDYSLVAARALAKQFNESGGFIPGWGFFGGIDWGGSVLIDTLMNLPLLVWAANEDANQRFMEIVCRHVSTSLKYQLRNNSSVCHMFRFDSATGAPLGPDTYQGLNPESSWSRGQAWALTGLAILAKMTGFTTYSQISEQISTYFLSHLPKDSIPPWDFSASGLSEPKDSSAAAIASYGLLKLFIVTGNPNYIEKASTLLYALFLQCTNQSTEGGLLLHATADLPHGLGIDASTMYGDYYYLKSLMLMKKLRANAKS